MGCHSIKVLLEIVEHGGMITDSNKDKLLNEAAELQKHQLEVKRPISPLGKISVCVANCLRSAQSIREW
jgi:hypothetical protein